MASINIMIIANDLCNKTYSIYIKIPILSILGILGKSGNFWQFGQFRATFGNSGHFGQCWSILGNSWHFWQFWDFSGHGGMKWFRWSEVVKYDPRYTFQIYCYLSRVSNNTPIHSSMRREFIKELIICNARYFTHIFLLHL